MLNPEGKLVVIAGPTASGKTALAVKIAKAYGGEVISADSMQIYKGMDIGTAKPDAAEMDGVRHHMIDVCDPAEPFSVARYVEMATPIVLSLLEKARLPVVAGGTGLYIDALIKGEVFAAPPHDYSYRRELEALAEREGNEALFALLQECDAKSAQRLHPNDVKRVIRALEVYHTTGKTISEHNAETKKAPPRFRAVIIGLNFKDRQTLYRRIGERVDAMLAAGLEQEVSRLLSSGVPQKATSMQAIGYKEMAAYIAGGESLDEAVFNIKRETRRYAKRQITWFKSIEGMNWIYADGLSQNRVYEQAEKILSDNAVIAK